MIKAEIRYKGGSPFVKNTFFHRTQDYYGIYDLLMELTGNDHEESANAASWCEIAGVGEIFEFREGEIEIVEIN